MRAGQWESGSSMTEIGRGPAAGRVTISTGVAEIRLHMVWIAGRVEISLVTRITVGWRTSVSRCMAGGAGRVDMLPGQRKGRVGVVESRWRPAIGRMADSAVLTEPLRDVIRVSDRFEIGLVAAIAVHRCSGEASTVTRGA